MEKCEEGYTKTTRKHALSKKAEIFEQKCENEKEGHTYIQKVDCVGTFKWT
jgi:hypothetical protein